LAHHASGRFSSIWLLSLSLVIVVVVWQRFLMPQNAAPVTNVSTPVVDTVNVIVVTQRIPRGSALDENVLGMVPIQRDLFIQGMFTNIAEVNGRLARFDLDAGIPLTSGMLVDTAESSRPGLLRPLDPARHGSVSIPITGSRGSYAPKPGDHVNVIVTLLMADYDQDFQTILLNQTGLLLGPGPINPEAARLLVTIISDSGPDWQGRNRPGAGVSLYVSPSEPQRPRMVSRLCSRCCRYMGEFPTDDETRRMRQRRSPLHSTYAPAQGQAEGQDEQAPVDPAQPSLISLIVAPQDAITLNYLIYSGARLTLALRSAGDDTRVQTEAVTLQYLMDQYNIPVPVKLPYGIPNRANDDHLEPFVPAPDPTATPVP
jgi:pilus assembly protein CpaB